MALYVLSPFVSNVVAATAGSGTSSAAQSFTLYGNTSSLVISNLASGSSHYMFYMIAYDYSAVPATFTDQNTGVIGPSSTVSISIGTSTDRPGSGTDGALKLFFAMTSATHQARLTQILVNRT